MSEKVLGITAPCSTIPQVELKLGLKRLSESGVDFRLDETLRARHLYFAGDHQKRARAFIKMAYDPEISVLWAARGGYGALNILPLLEEVSRRRGQPPKKRLAGFSDVTALHAFVSSRWGWECIHSPMPCFKEIPGMSGKLWRDLLQKVLDDYPKGDQFKIRHLYGPKSVSMSKVVGGNLSVWCALVGTGFFPKVAKQILVLEDVGETYCRLDRMVQQMSLGGVFDHVRAIILGEFYGCRDAAPEVLEKFPAIQSDWKKTKPLRPLVSWAKARDGMFRELSKKYRLGVFEGLPIGHGPKNLPLALYKRAEISKGIFRYES